MTIPPSRVHANPRAPPGVIENPKRNAPLATLIGLGLAAVVYILSSTVIMGIIPNDELQRSHAPFAEAARLAIGTPAMVIVALCAILKSVGSLGGWMLLVGQSAKAAASDGLFPAIFGRVNRHGVPGVGLVIVSVLMTAVLFATQSPTIAEQFNLIIDLAVIVAVIPYIYASVAVLPMLRRHEQPRSTLVKYRIIVLVAVVYCLATIIGGDARTVMLALVALLVTVPLYAAVEKRMGEARKGQAGD